MVTVETAPQKIFGTEILLASGRKYLFRITWLAPRVRLLFGNIGQRKSVCGHNSLLRCPKCVAETDLSIIDHIN